MRYISTRKYLYRRVAALYLLSTSIAIALYTGCSLFEEKVLNDTSSSNYRKGLKNRVNRYDEHPVYSHEIHLLLIAYDFPIVYLIWLIDWYLWNKFN